MAKHSANQMDLFTISPTVADIRSKQVKDLCAWGWFNISTHHRKMIRHSKGELFVEVKAIGDKGIPTYHDNDILVFLTSYMVHAINSGEEPGRNIFFTANEFFNFTGKNTIGGFRYELIWDALNRLQQTSIHTNIPVGEVAIEEKWSFLPRVCRAYSKKTGRTIGFEVELSTPIYRAITQQVPQVLTLHRDYFSLRSGFHKWMYLYARRFAGTDGREFIATEKDIHSFCGSTQPLTQFRKLLTKSIDDDVLLDYEAKQAMVGSERAVAFRRKRLAPPKVIKPTLILE